MSPLVIRKKVQQKFSNKEKSTSINAGEIINNFPTNSKSHFAEANKY